MASLSIDLKSQLEVQQKQLESTEQVIHKVRSDHGNALDFSMAEKNREMDRLRQQLEELQPRLEAAEEANRIKDKERVYLAMQIFAFWFLWLS